MGNHICLNCTKSFIRAGKVRKYCSKECYDLKRIGTKQTKEHSAKISLALKGKPFTESHKHAIRLAKNTPEAIAVAIANLKDGHKGRKFTFEHRKKLSNAHKGEKAYQWKGGVIGKACEIRNSMEYREWRKLILKRDNYTCVLCGDKYVKGHSVKIQADHIKSFVEYPDLRFDLENGRTLCVHCHRQTHNYGWKGYHINKTKS